MRISDWSSDVCSSDLFVHEPRNLFLPTGLARQTGPARAERFADASPLRPRAWISGNAIEVRIEPPSATLFNAAWASGPTAVELDDGAPNVRLVRSVAGRYLVHQRIPRARKRDSPSWKG